MVSKSLLVVAAFVVIGVAYSPIRVWFLASSIRLIIGGLGLGLLYAVLSHIQADEWRGGLTGLLKTKDAVVSTSKVDGTFEAYESHFGTKSRTGDKQHDELLRKRQASYADMVQHFYDLVTDFYEYGWGDCFHFAPRFIGEEFQESLRRAEYFLASKIRLDEKTHALDVGCGVGGPMRNIARFTLSKVTGANISDYQIKVGNKRNKELHLDNLCTLVKADFMKLPYKEATFDGAYAIEATCHAPNKTDVFAEVFRTLKPGGLFSGFDWIVTDKYDAKNKMHVALREGIEVGNGLPVLATADGIKKSLRKAGFEILEAYDFERVVHQPGQIPWYESLGGAYTVKGFRRTKPGRAVTQVLVTVLEALRIAPKGTAKVSSLLNATADDLWEAGHMEIFTPSYYWLARKPEA